VQLASARCTDYPTVDIRQPTSSATDNRVMGGRRHFLGAFKGGAARGHYRYNQRKLYGPLHAGNDLPPGAGGGIFLAGGTTFPGTHGLGSMAPPQPSQTSLNAVWDMHHLGGHGPSEQPGGPETSSARSPRGMSLADLSWADSEAGRPDMVRLTVRAGGPAALRR